MRRGTGVGSIAGIVEPERVGMGVKRKAVERERKGKWLRLKNGLTKYNTSQ